MTSCSARSSPTSGCAGTTRPTRSIVASRPTIGCSTWRARRTEHCSPVTGNWRRGHELRTSETPAATAVTSATMAVDSLTALRSESAVCCSNRAWSRASCANSATRATTSRWSSDRRVVAERSRRSGGREREYPSVRAGVGYERRLALCRLRSTLLEGKSLEIGRADSRGSLTLFSDRSVVVASRLFGVIYGARTSGGESRSAVVAGRRPATDRATGRRPCTPDTLRICPPSHGPGRFRVPRRRRPSRSFDPG